MPPALRSRNSAKKDPRKPVKKAQQTPKEENPVPTTATSGVVSPGNELGLVYPSPDTAFKALLSARFCAAIWSNISDCDETYNFWEPSHYMLFGQGMQTWEYSPKYALRSYSYILLHVLPALLYHHVLQPNRLLVFFFCRCLLGLFCALCEAYFYRSICREFGIHVGRLTLAFMVFSSGMYISATAFLPSSFSMYMCLLSLGAWYQRKYELAVFATALSSFLSWPFAALLGLPIAVDMLFRRKEIWKFSRLCIISVIFILLPMIKMDSDMYGRLVVAPYNIVLYNVFSNSGGSELYGTEPWYFYFLNGVLNFNLVFLMALLCVPVLLLASWLVPCKPRNSACLPYWLSLSPLFLWLAVFCIQPHKEERFLFPVYPLISLCGAITLDAAQKLWFRLKQVMKKSPATSQVYHYLRHTEDITLAICLICTLLGISRSFALYRGYHAPLDIYMEFSKMPPLAPEVISRPINVCVGKEWHRFPSSYFLPGNNWHLQFLRSEFRGQLPQQYPPGPNGTIIEPPHMNNLNQEEPSRYFDVEKCNFLVDLDYGEETEREPCYSKQSNRWKIVASIPFLNPQRSPMLLRAFYIPGLTEYLCEYGSYNLLESIGKMPQTTQNQGRL